MSFNNKKIPVINNINSLNAQVLYLRKKKKTKPTPTPPEPTPTPSDNQKIYQISFFYDDEREEINPEEHKDEYGFKVKIEHQSIDVPVAIKSLVYCDGETITDITPELFSIAIDQLDIFDHDQIISQPQYNLYLYIPYISKTEIDDQEEIIKKNVWAGYKSIKTTYIGEHVYPEYTLSEEEFDGKTSYESD